MLILKVVNEHLLSVATVTCSTDAHGENRHGEYVHEWKQEMTWKSESEGRGGNGGDDGQTDEREKVSERAGGQQYCRLFLFLFYTSSVSEASVCEALVCEVPGICLFCFFVLAPPPALSYWFSQCGWVCSPALPLLWAQPVHMS